MPVEDFHLYIPAAKRKAWDGFRDRLENEGRLACDVLLELVESYMAGSSRTSRDSAKATQ